MVPTWLSLMILDVLGDCLDAYFKVSRGLFAMVSQPSFLADYMKRIAEQAIIS